MYCSNCGTRAAGNFCSQCGARIAQAAASAAPAVAAPGWEDEIRYDVLLHFPEVRDRIAAHAAQARGAFDPSVLLELCEAAVKPLGGVSVSKLTKLVQPLSARLGIESAKTRAEHLPNPPGKTLVAVLCSLAQHGRTIKQVQQTPNACTLEAILPQGLRSLEGEVVISVERLAQGSRLEATTKIPGQYYDWGKCEKWLSELIDEVRRLSA